MRVAEFATLEQAELAEAAAEAKADETFRRFMENPSPALKGSATRAARWAEEVGAEADRMRADREMAAA